MRGSGRGQARAQVRCRRFAVARVRGSAAEAQGGRGTCGEQSRFPGGQPSAASRRGFVACKRGKRVRSARGRVEVISRSFPGGGNCSQSHPPLFVAFSAWELAAPAPPPVRFPLPSISERPLAEARPPEPARVPGGGAGLSAAEGAPRASHHLAEPLLKTQPSVCADAAFLPEKNHC